MATTKRFFDTSILPKNWRKLSKETKLTFYYLWYNCDAAGVWEIDLELFAFENNFKLEPSLVEALNITQYKSTHLLLNDFIAVNYTELKQDYNPHKPCFRAIEKNKLILNSSLNQAYFKLVDEEEDVYKDEEVKEDVIVKPIFDFEKKLIEYCFEKNLIVEWLSIRKKKKAVNSETAFNGFVKEIEKCKDEKNEILKYIITKSWQGFEAKWLDNSNYKKTETKGINHNTSIDNF